ncbi:MAG TPA: tyrosine-protein phosphatase [Mycobacteriales bacterium]|jgi:hypothetical protein|nr:tyrosine-protein phosphatase [Mycobacteriales bacterium]
MDREPVLPRRVTLEGACNIRDLGGYRTSSGEQVRHGLLFRGDSPHRLTDADAVSMRELGIRTVLDLRSEHERETLGAEPLAAFGVRTVHVPFRHAPGRAQVLRIVTDGPPPDLADLYRGFLDHSGPEFAAVVETVADSERLPLLFHCLAGKDRTGVVAALLLSLLGVPDDVVATDYAASTAVMERFRTLAAADRELLGLTDFSRVNPALLGSDAATMHKFLDLVRTRHGSAAGLVEHVGIDSDAVERFRGTMLTR